MGSRTWLWAVFLWSCAPMVLAYVKIDPTGTVIIATGESLTLSCEATESLTRTPKLETDDEWTPQRYAQNKRSVDGISFRNARMARRQKRALVTLTQNITNAGPWDTNRWLCKSVDDQDQTTESVHVDIVVVQVDKSEDMLVGDIDDTGASIWCSCVNLDPDLCVIEWKKSGQRISSGSGARDLDDDGVPDVMISSDTQGLSLIGNRPADSAVYTCTAEVTVGGQTETMESKDISVYVHTSNREAYNQNNCDALNDNTESTSGTTFRFVVLPDWVGYKMHSGYLTVKVKAAKNAIIRLKSMDEDSPNFFEIELGIDENTKSTLTRYIGTTEPESVEADTPSILSAGEYRSFTIIYASDMIEVRKGKETMPFLSITKRHGRAFDPDPEVSVKVVEFGTGYNVEGSFSICNPDTRDTGLKLTEPYKIWGAILTAVLGCFAIFVALCIAVCQTCTCDCGDCDCDCADERRDDAGAEAEAVVVVGAKPTSGAQDAPPPYPGPSISKDPHMMPLAPSYGEHPDDYDGKRRHKKHRKKHRKHKRQSFSPYDDYYDD